MKDIRLGQPNFDALPLEYKLKNRAAHGDLDVTNLINNPAANGKCRIFRLGLKEELFDIGLAKFGALLDNRADPLLVAQDSV